MAENDELLADYKDYYLNNVFRPDLNPPPKKDVLTDLIRKFILLTGSLKELIILFLIFIYLVWRCCSYFCGAKRGPKKRKGVSLFNIPCWSLERIQREFNRLKIPGQYYHKGELVKYDPPEEEIILIRDIEQMLMAEKKP